MRVHRAYQLLLTAFSSLVAVTVLAAPAEAAPGPVGPPLSVDGSAALSTCRVTPYSAVGLYDDYTTTWYGQDHLWAGLDRAYQGVWYAGQDLILQWRIPNPKKLSVTGRRLDATAPPLQVSFPPGYSVGFQQSGLLFPTAGCWQVTATIPGQTLRFTVYVHPAAEFAVLPPPSAGAVGITGGPLVLPALAAGASCPLGPVRQIPRVAGGVLGTWPVFLQALGGNGVVDLGDSGTIAVRWLIAPNAQGLLLVRGRQLSGAAAVQFGESPAPELAIPDALRLRVPDWRVLSFPMQVPGPGCYGIQVEGLHFREVIVFEAVPGLPPGYAATPQP